MSTGGGGACRYCGEVTRRCAARTGRTCCGTCDHRPTGDGPDTTTVTVYIEAADEEVPPPLGDPSETW